jgi:hypothetical protein
MEPDDEDFGQCECGGAWFFLTVQGDDEDAEGPGVVCIDTEGTVTGYAGELACAECSKPWDPNVKFKPARGHLRVVQ